MMIAGITVAEFSSQRVSRPQPTRAWRKRFNSP
jgi:hypothetical protein